MRNLFFNLLIIGAALFTSCNKIEPKDVTVIDGISLGTTLEEYYKQCEDLNISQKLVYTKVFFSDFQDVYHNSVKFYVTDIFNFSEYRGPDTEHFGIYNSIIMSGTKNVIGLNILLVHTAPAVIFSPSGSTYLTKQTKIPGVIQDVSLDLVEDIGDMLSKKYGKPNGKMKSEHFTVKVIEGNQIKNYRSDSTNMGELLYWETEYFDISFFKGINSTASTFTSNGNSYTIYFDTNPNTILDYDSGERPCRSYSYITYKLNSKAIKRLALDKPKL
jgi:hypothetical protein